MTSLFLIFLFILQMITFYFLVLLNTKIAKFNDLEKKQQHLMDEMDNSLAAYLSEVKDENDQLIKRLAAVEKEQPIVKVESTSTSEKLTEDIKQAQEPLINLVTPKIPVNLALKSYASTKLEPIQEEPVEEQPTDDRSRAIQLYDAGKSVEEIARVLGKGQTEVELILKFR